MLATVAALSMVTACTEVKDSLRSANEKIHELTGASPEQDASTSTAKANAAADSAADADVAMAERLINGDGVPRDPARGVALLRPRAAAGHPQAQYLLGVALQRGDGTVRDEAQAAEWFGKSAQSGNVDAQYQLAVAYSRGQGVERDVAAASQWFERAAEQGHADAQYRAGEAYQIGRGVAKNRAWATRWFAKAALQGVADAQYMTGLAYTAGGGVPRDQALAYRWLSIAAMQGVDKAASYRDRIGARLAADRRSRETARAKAWRPLDASATAGATDAPSVTFAQYSLAKLGFDPGGVDGKFGPKTRGAVEAFQSAEGLATTGTITVDLLHRFRDDPIYAQQ